MQYDDDDLYENDMENDCKNLVISQKRNLILFSLRLVKKFDLYEILSYYDYIFT
jgi:hypothetical protein